MPTSNCTTTTTTRTDSTGPAGAAGAAMVQLQMLLFLRLMLHLLRRAAGSEYRGRNRLEQGFGVYYCMRIQAAEIAVHATGPNRQAP